MLGVAVAEVRSAADVAALVAAETVGRMQRFRGWTEWTTRSFTVSSGSPVEAGVDGEALLLDPPLEFRCLPGSAAHSPASTRAGLLASRTPVAVVWWTVTALLRTAAGHPTPIDETKR